jgi:hypothetical protein
MMFGSSHAPQEPINPKVIEGSSFKIEHSTWPNLEL